MAGVLGMMSSIFKKTPEEKADTRTLEPSCFITPLTHTLIHGSLAVLKLIHSPKFLAEPCKLDPSRTWEDYCKEVHSSRLSGWTCRSG
jgi:hypothetical protein